MRKKSNYELREEETLRKADALERGEVEGLNFGISIANRNKNREKGQQKGQPIRTEEYLEKDKRIVQNVNDTIHYGKETLHSGKGTPETKNTFGKGENRGIKKRLNTRIWELYIEDELNQKEIAFELGIAEKTVTRHLNKYGNLKTGKFKEDYR